MPSIEQMNDDIKQALEAALNGNRERERDDPSIPQREAQAMELRLVFTQTHLKPARPVVPGDFVVWKHGCGPVANRYREKLVFMFWAYLSDIPEHARAKHIKAMSSTEVATLPAPDCLLCHWQQDSFVFQIADSSMIDLAPDSTVT